MPAFENAVVVVTGASTGLGRAIATGAAAEGALAVVINYAASAAEAEETARQVAAAGAEPLLAQGDVGELDHCRRIVAAAERFGRIDALFANAGTSKLASAPGLDGLTADDFLAIYRTNVVGAYQTVQAARGLLEASERAAVVCTSSVAGVIGSGSSIAYVASKGALNMMVKALARELAPRIRINAFCPGFIDSPWFDKLGYPGGAAALRDHIAKSTPLKAASTPEDLAGGALFLASPAARHITGETLLADAGLHLG